MRNPPVSCGPVERTNYGALVECDQAASRAPGSCVNCRARPDSASSTKISFTPVRRREGEMAPVRRPRGILVDPLARQLLYRLVPQRNGHDLKTAVELRLERDQPPVGRPVGIAAIVLVAEV